MASNEYDAFGANMGPGPSDSSYRWVGAKGYLSDAESGMDWLGSRFYLPVLGRFLTADPIGHGGGLNLYEYCDDNPLTRFDPSGHQWQKSLPRKHPPKYDVRRSLRVISLKLEQLRSDFDTDWRVKINVPGAGIFAGADYMEEKMRWFYNEVVDGGPWDYKKNGHPEWADFGNWNYGYVAAALGISDYLAAQGAGLNQTWKRMKGQNVPGTGIPFIIPPYGDDIRDFRLIQQGAAAFRNDVKTGRIKWPH